MLVPSNCHRSQADMLGLSFTSCCSQVLQMIPESNHVGLITFGTHVHVHELGYEGCSKAFVFRGGKEYTSSQVRVG